MEWSDLFTYSNGSLTWRIGKGRARAGTLAGYTRTNDGYRSVMVNGKNWMVHRIVWELYRGALSPNHEIDHVNGNRSDNRIENLRMVTRQENAILGTPKLWETNTSGATGVFVYPGKRGTRYKAYIDRMGGRRYLGSFPTLGEAKRARVEAKPNATISRRP